MVNGKAGPFCKQIVSARALLQGLVDPVKVLWQRLPGCSSPPVHSEGYKIMHT